jgi:hypothetical protein
MYNRCNSAVMGLQSFFSTVRARNHMYAMNLTNRVCPLQKVLLTVRHTFRWEHGTMTHTVWHLCKLTKRRSSALQVLSLLYLHFDRSSTKVCAAALISTLKGPVRNSSAACSLISHKMIGKSHRGTVRFRESFSVLQHVHRIDISIFIARHFPSVQHLATARCPLQRQEFARICNHGKPFGNLQLQCKVTQRNHRYSPNGRSADEAVLHCC